VFSIAIHPSPVVWRGKDSLQQLKRRWTRPVAFDLDKSEVGGVKLVSGIVAEGVPMREVYDGYIFLTRDQDYQPATLMPEVYTDAFAKGVYEKLQQKRKLQLENTPAYFPDELRVMHILLMERPPTGMELMRIIHDNDQH
jgi:hypothetical protein